MIAISKWNRRATRHRASRLVLLVQRRHSTHQPMGPISFTLPRNLVHATKVLHQPQAASKRPAVPALPHLHRRNHRSPKAIDLSTNRVRLVLVLRKIMCITNHHNHFSNPWRHRQLRPMLRPFSPVPFRNSESSNNSSNSNSSSRSRCNNNSKLLSPKRRKFSLSTLSRKIPIRFSRMPQLLWIQTQTCLSSPFPVRYIPQMKTKLQRSLYSNSLPT